MTKRQRQPEREERGTTKKPAIILALILFLTGLCCISAGEEKPEPALLLKPAELSLKKGGSAKVTPSVTNMPAGVRIAGTEWSSSDPETAEFRSGAVRANGGGQAVLTCAVTLSDDTVLTARCPVTVTVPVTGLKAQEAAVTVMAGDAFLPAFTVFPADATNPGILLTSSDEAILSAGSDGRVTARAEGKAYLTAVSEENPAKKARMTVTVTRRVGKADTELTFLGVPWESSCEESIRLLKESGFIAPEAGGRCGYTGTAWHWPEQDLLFSRISAWRSLPASLTELKAGAVKASLNPQQTVGGYMPQIASLVFLGGIGEDGRIDPGITRLIGVYFSFGSQEEKGAAVFRGLLNRLEADYGAFTACLAKDFPRYYPELYAEIEDAVSGAERYALQETGDGFYPGEYVICTIRGMNHTGIMLNMDTNGTVTLFWGRTDAAEMIRALDQAAAQETGFPEDTGL